MRRNPNADQWVRNNLLGSILGGTDRVIYRVQAGLVEQGGGARGVWRQWEWE